MHRKVNLSNKANLNILHLSTMSEHVRTCKGKSSPVMVTAVRFKGAALHSITSIIRKLISQNYRIIEAGKSSKIIKANLLTQHCQGQH